MCDVVRRLIDNSTHFDRQLQGKDIMAENKRRHTVRREKEEILREKKPGFRPGKSGVCEAQLWEFTGPGKFRAEDEDIPVERVAAASLDRALGFMRRRYPDFTISKAEAMGMIAMLSGSPLDYPPEK